VTDIRNCLRSISQDVLAFEEIFSTANVQEQGRIDVPQQLVTAWLHVLSGLLCAVARTEGWRIHLAKAGILISQSLSDIVQDMPSGQLLEKASMLPMEVLSLLTMELLKDKVGKSDDIGDTYSQYLSSIVRGPAVSTVFLITLIALTARRTPISRRNRRTDRTSTESSSSSRR
jgi:hypothetical protein